MFYHFFQYATNIQVLPDCFSFMTGISSLSNQLTPVYLFHVEKKVKQSCPLYLLWYFQPPPCYWSPITWYHMVCPRQCSAAHQQFISASCALHGMKWYHMVSHGIRWHHTASHGITWHHMASNGITWHHMASHGII